MSDLHRTIRRGDKRERLVSAAADLMHQQGLEGMTLARVAEAADVPLGNVYYYFKTRDDLIRAVVKERTCQVKDRLASISSRGKPHARLKALVRSWADSADLVASYGCPIGGLASGLARHADELAGCAEIPFRELVDWAAAQFREMGERNAAARAVSLIGSVQGACLLANTFNDPQLLVREVRRLERELDQMAAEA